MSLDPRIWNGIDGIMVLLSALGAEAGATRLVGGFVRDALLGETGQDIDLATVHAPDAVMARLRAAGLKAVPTGLAHGTVTAVLPGGRPVEVTTLRRDVATDGRHALVAFTDDWRADAARRDFTINALFADPLTGAVFDFFDGMTDFAARRVRFIGDPLQRIAEDHLRILRFFRFEARFGSGMPDDDGLAACSARANDLLSLSRERIAGELLRLLGLPHPERTIAIMVDRRILAPVLPEIDAAGVDRLGRLIVREHALGADGIAIRRLAALLPVNSVLAAQISGRLKLSNSQRRALVLAADPTLDADPMALAWHNGTEAAIDRLLLGPESIEDARVVLEALQGWQKPTLPVTGGDLIAMGLPRGPIVAVTLARLTECWIASGFPERDWVHEAARRVVEHALGPP